MSILTVEKLSKSYGNRTLFQEVSFHIEEQDRVGFVGANGTGKSTLFKLLTGKEEADSGRIAKAAGLVIGTMEQHVPEDTVQTAGEWVLSAFSHLLCMEKQMEQVQKTVETGTADETVLLRQQALREQYEREGGLYFRSRANAALTGLGFTREQKDLPLSSLSGGQRSKLGLARLLIAPAGLLLLDEPTNHLDLAAIQWLEEFLRTYDGAFVVVSHDRYFLDRVTSATMELSQERLWVFSGNYSAYLSHKQQRKEIARQHYEQQIREIHRLEEAVTEMRRWNREKSVKRAESKQKVIDKLTDSLEKPEEEQGTIHFTFHVKHTGPNEVLNARGLTLGFGGEPLYTGVDLQLHRGERVFLIGANGCGKTSLLRQLTGENKAQGRIEYGPGVTVGYYDQTGAQLHPDKTVLDEVWDDYPRLDQTQVRSSLAAFLFRGEDVFKQVAACSGGERARIALLKTMLGGNNLLLLDEPTNHLDIGSREALEDALAGYDGTLLMVSHDRYLINKLAHRVLLLTKDGLKNFEGDYDDFLAAVEWTAPPAEKKAGAGAGGQDYKARKLRESELRKLRTAVTRTEREIAQLEEQAQDLRLQLDRPGIASDYVKIMELTRQLQETESRLEQCTDRWAEESMRLEAAESGTESE